jgi:transposase
VVLIFISRAWKTCVFHVILQKIYMLKVEIKSGDIPVLEIQRYEHPHPGVQKKMEALYLKGIGIDNCQICKILNVTNNTLLKYFRQYADGSIERLKEIKFYRPQSDLKEFSVRLEQYFLDNPPQSIREASAKIRELTGLERKETQVRKFLKPLKFRFIKVGSVPARTMTEGKKRAEKIFGRKH